MTADPQAPPRLHALDNLRALMMWLGIVLHVAVIYATGEMILPWRDTERSRFAELLMAFIHAFRMPVFFILAGFFVALLLQKRGPQGMARHRAMRLGLTFALFWPPVFVATVAVSLVFLHEIARGTWGFDASLVPVTPTVRPGLNTMHLWFLWMLLWMSLATAAIARWRPAGWGAPARVLQRAGAAWWGPVLLALPLVVAALPYDKGLLRPSGAFLPPPAEWLHNGLFYVFGLALYHQQWDLFALYRLRWGRYLAAGAFAFLATGALMERHAPGPAIAFAYNFCSWCLGFAAIGLALQFMDRRHAALAYLADSSYWVYIVHMPFTMLFGLLLYGAPLPALAKMAIGIAGTTAICLASYHAFVRFTWVGALLNGQRHARTPSGTLNHVST